MNLRVEFDFPTAKKVAEYFESAGMHAAASRMWVGLCIFCPHDRSLREKAASVVFDPFEANYPRGSVQRSTFILHAISQTFPTAKLSSAYLENLAELMKARPKRSQPGRVILATGTGRCGSTTLAAAVANLPDVCATHENPPTLDWKPLEEQIRFHMDRLRILRDYYSVVFDASHWWLNVTDRFFAEFPEGRIIGLHRDLEACVKSFMQVKGYGPGTTNHWAPEGNEYWGRTLWDPAYPSYPIREDLMPDLDAVKADQIRRYVMEYNALLRSRAETSGGKIVSIRTEDLNSHQTAARLSELFGVPLTISRSLNVGHTSDSEPASFRF